MVPQCSYSIDNSASTSNQQPAQQAQIGELQRVISRVQLNTESQPPTENEPPQNGRALKQSNRYQSILERMLQLRDDVVTDSIRSAIRLIVRDRRTTNSNDWLRVIFKSLEIILGKINVQNISANVINISRYIIHYCFCAVILHDMALG